MDGGTTFNGVVADATEELQNAETVDRQNPQAVNPIYDMAEADLETIDTFQAVEGKNGSEIVLKDGTLPGALLEMDIDNVGKGEMTIDISDTQEVVGEELVITTGPENVMIGGGKNFVDADATEISLLAGADRDADDGRQVVYLN